jgi:hypothetical protein
MIDQVIALEVRSKPDRRNDPHGRKNIIEIRQNLRRLGIPGYAYFGPMEEVLVLGKDYDGTVYEQGGMITLYNLDFCDEIGSRIETREYGKKLWRFEAIREILRNQYECYKRTRKPNAFILMVTIRNQINGDKLNQFLREDLLQDTHAYVRNCLELMPIPEEGYLLGTHGWAIKAFIHNIMRQYLANPHISAIFFPLVKYTGKPAFRGKIESPMLHLMTFCKFEAPENHKPTFLPIRYCDGISSVRASDDQRLEWEADIGETQPFDFAPSSVDFFRQFENDFAQRHVIV